ncbi:MAG: outer membrane lipid asymmetry maintenance protein MlaD [Gammaproteobacteria bacterium]|nr:outer membrane lipid asymmetry maintenance protein MlaD [Gammaproteobacteria bacterium]
MWQSRVVEIWVGLFVAAGLAALFMLAMQVSNLSVMSTEGGYTVDSHFDNVSGLKVRAPVTIAGVRIGRVTDIGFDSKTFQAVVTMRISDRYNKIPTDSVAGVYTSGLLGEKYIGIKPGIDDTNLKNGDRVKGGQSALVLEDLIGKFLFNKAAEGPGK